MDPAVSHMGAVIIFAREERYHLVLLIVRHAVRLPSVRRATADIICLRAVAWPVLQTPPVTDRQRLPAIRGIKKAALRALKIRPSVLVRHA